MTDDWSAWDGDPEDTADLGGDGGDGHDGDPTGPDDGGGAAGFGPADADYDPPADADAGFGDPGDASGTTPDPTAAYGVDPYGDETGDPGRDETGDPGRDETGDAQGAGEPGLGPVGADPDVDPYADGSWPAPAFPDAIDGVAPPEPVDGYPWVDPATLGDPGAVAEADDPTPTAGVDPADLAEYAALDPGTPLSATDDPATAALARFWGIS